MYREIKELNNLIISVDNYEIISINYWLKLLNNNKIKKYFDKVFENVSSIEENQISFCDDIVIDLIKLYCEQNKIKYIENIDIKYDENKVSDNNLRLFLKDIKKYPLLSSEKEFELLKDYKINKNKESKDIIIYSNQRLIFKCINQRNLEPSYFLDLIQEGNLGLLEAIEKYDLKFNCKFSTYSYWYVKRNINNAINMNNLINKSRKNKELENKIRAYINKIITIENRTPTKEELCEEFNININKLELILKDYNAISLNQPVSEEEPTELIELLEDEYILSEEIENIEICKSIYKELEKTKLKDINELLYLKYKKGLKHSEIAEIYNISEQAVSAKIIKAQEKVRKLDKFKDLVSKDIEKK